VGLRRWLVHKILERRLNRRIKSLSKADECPGCEQRGPWLAVFIHPLCPPHLRGADGRECDYCEQMPASVKVARLMMLGTLGIPLHPDIIENVNKCVFEDADPQAMALINHLHEQMVEEMGDDYVDGIRKRKEPNSSDDELPLGGTTDGWREWDMDN